MDFLIGGGASAGAVLFTNPLEVVKTRMQLQGELKARGHFAVTYRNVFHALYVIPKVDGVSALQKGLAPALCYQFIMNGTRRALYQVLLESEVFGSHLAGSPVAQHLLSGAMAGAVASFITSPFFMVKTQLQARSSDSIAVGYQHKEATLRSSLRSAYAASGIRGVYRGAPALAIRVTFGSAAEVTSFAVAKDFLHSYEIFHATSLNNSVAASLLSGIAVVLTITPFDVLTTRLYNQGIDSRGRGLLYSGYSDCVYKIITREGPLGFYKGLAACFFRLGPHTLLSLVFWDKLRGLRRQRNDA